MDYANRNYFRKTRPYVFDLKSGKDVTNSTISKFTSYRYDTICTTNNFQILSMEFDFSNELNCEYCSSYICHYSIPKVTTNDSALSAIADTTNKNFYSHINYDPNHLIEFTSWGGFFRFEFECDIKNEYLFLSINYSGLSMKGDYNVENESHIFNLNTGKEVDLTEVTEHKYDTICKAGDFKLISHSFIYPIESESSETLSYCESSFSIPMITTDDSALSPIADTINHFLREKISYDGNIEKFTENCVGISFDCQTKNNYILLDLDYLEKVGSYYWSDNNNSFLFDLRTGKLIQFGDEEKETSKIPFHLLFTMDGYHKFLEETNWTDSVAKHFSEDYRLFQMGCELSGNDSLEIIGNAQYEIDYSIAQNKLSFKTEWDAYFKTYYSYNVFINRIGFNTYQVSRSKEETAPYLSKIGKILFNTKKSRIEKFIEAKKQLKNCTKIYVIENFVTYSDCPYELKRLLIPENLLRSKKKEGYVFEGNGKKVKVTIQIDNDNIYFIKSKYWDCCLEYDKGKCDGCDGNSITGYIYGFDSHKKR